MAKNPCFCFCLLSTYYEILPYGPMRNTHTLTPLLHTHTPFSLCKCTESHCQTMPLKLGSSWCHWIIGKLDKRLTDKKFSICYILKKCWCKRMKGGVTGSEFCFIQCYDKKWGKRRRLSAAAERAEKEKEGKGSKFLCSLAWVFPKQICIETGRRRRRGSSSSCSSLSWIWR